MKIFSFVAIIFLSHIFLFICFCDAVKITFSDNKALERMLRSSGLHCVINMTDIVGQLAGKTVDIVEVIAICQKGMDVMEKNWLQNRVEDHMVRELSYMTQWLTYRSLFENDRVVMAEIKAKGDKR